MHWNICEIDTGTTWLVGYNVLGATTFGTRKNVSRGYSGSGRTRKMVWRSISFETIVIKCWLVERKGGDTVLSACASSVATTWRSGWIHLKET